MFESEFIARAAAPTVAIIQNVTADQLGRQTPCTEFDVRRLINHLLFWGPTLEAAARKESVPPLAASEADVDLTDSDWATALESQLDRIVAVWSNPEAWLGLTQMGSPMELPASLIGGMVIGEVVVHGWDLARATGQNPHWDDDLLKYVYEETAKNADQGREMGIYGPAVAMPASSPTLDRLLGLTGRDPHWTP
ncbi:TIGR03086 family metal-binding protein [Nocardia sp. NBC_00881]|uniref:TIGR03086 family metal-binding protein n=1 Tax=Nocardia sp. NBC_00881 TaxID=2975995 RepID=UPI00386BEBC0|nr:TIGR03086 family metal-binding protein [Nocardia sp. NBC_00881]